MSRVDELIKGYGPKFPTLDQLLASEPSEAERLRLESPIPGLGRYLRNVKFLSGVTSGRELGILRFRVITSYFLALAEELAAYTGIFSSQRIIPILEPGEIAEIRNMGRTVEDVYRAEMIERFADHDTAAATDYIKILIATRIPRLANNIDGVHFANTSEDVMGNVFGMMANNLVYCHFMPALLDFCDGLLNYVDLFETPTKPLIIPDFTHQQAAEPGTLGKKFTTRVSAINFLIQELRGPKGFKRFSGNLSGATGNLTCHYAAYPDIDWQKFAKRFVEGFGLRYDRMSDQCVTYVIEAKIFVTIANILDEIIKLTEDFVNLASCPSQFFVKEKKEGEKGSSIMPNKCNAWGMEGAIRMLREGVNNLLFLSRELPKYPHQGDMGRSYLFRNIGGYFMPIFIALSRISSEMRKYHPNPAKIQAFLSEYPGMAGSSLQTVMKRMGISGDAYRAIQQISINLDGSYANAEQFRLGLGEKMREFSLSENQRAELNALLNPRKLVAPVHKLVRREMGILRKDFQRYRRELKHIVPMDISKQKNGIDFL